MSGEEEVIVIGGGGGGKRNASPVKTTVKPQGWHNWKTVLKQYSTWVLLFVMALPEAFQLAVSYGIVNVSGGDDPISKVAQLVAAVGLVLKFVKQQKPAA